MVTINSFGGELTDIAAKLYSLLHMRLDVRNQSKCKRARTCRAMNPLRFLFIESLSKLTQSVSHGFASISG